MSLQKRFQVPLSAAARWFENRLDFLAGINEALRNINRGKNDHLPYYESIPGYSLVMTSELKPRGDNKPPAVGKWQLTVRREDQNIELALQGLVRDGQSFGDLVLRCEDTELSAELDRLANEPSTAEN